MGKYSALAGSIASEIYRNSAEVDLEAKFPEAGLKSLRDSGLFGLLVPNEYGGLGGDLGDVVDVAIEVGGGCLSTAMIWAMHCQQVDVLVRHANTRLRAEVLPRIVEDGYYLASITTEPGSGADLNRAESALGEEGNNLRIDRDAPVVTGGEYADGFLVTMRADVDAASTRVSLVHVHRDQLTNVNVVNSWDTMGMRGTRSVGLHLSGQAEQYQLVGKKGDFRTIAADSMVPAGHLAWSACWLGATRSALSNLCASIRSGEVAASSMGEAKRHRLARARLDVELATAYLLRVRDSVLNHRAARIGSDRSLQIQLNAVKVICSELSFHAVDELVQVGGLTVGYKRDVTASLERPFRDLRSASLNYSNDRLLTAIGTMTLLDGAGPCL